MKQLRLSRALTLTALTLASAVTCALLPASAAFAQFDFTVVMSGLNNPRGLAFGPGGALFVTEAGVGGSGTTVTTGDGSAQSLGFTSSVSRLLGGVQSRVFSGAPSLAVTAGGAPGNGATGLQDITFVNGQAYGLIGLGGDPAIRNSFTAGENANGAQLLGNIVTLALDGSNTITSVADVSAHEAANNPGGGNPGDDVNSNPYGFIALPGGGFAVTDAGGNTLLGVSAGGTVSTLSVLAPRPNPLPFGPPVYQSVPTGIALAPDGSSYFTELTGVPFPAGAANIYRFDPLTNVTSVAYTGFTNLLDLAFAPDGSLYALQLTTNGLASQTGPGPGVLTKIGTDGSRTNISGPTENLFFPTAIAVGSDGAIYVSNQGNFAGAGQVVRITATAPEPGSLPLLAGGLMSLAGLGLVRRRRGAK
ncbi:MAG: ScyD/ScyE family protein [Cytophagales bacterium]|nr:ScyD/ScyE family protein [Armatimonadota bacterium]